MNLLFRMLYVLLSALFRPRIGTDEFGSRLRLRTLPNDLDINLHMNNGRYLTICDLNRVDLFIRSGLAKQMLKRKWMPMIADHTMTYKKPLKLFEPFEVELAVTHWDAKYFYMTHTFTAGGRVAAVGTSKGVIRSREGVVDPGLVMESVGLANRMPGTAV
jgi:acyl-CoA thioesterase FadM